MAISRTRSRGMQTLSKGGRHGICRNIMMAGNTGGGTKQSARSSSGSVHHQLHLGCDFHPAISTPPAFERGLVRTTPIRAPETDGFNNGLRLCNGKGGGGSSSDVEGGVRCDVRPRGETWHLGSERCHRLVVCSVHVTEDACLFFSLSALFFSLCCPL